ncbi:uncharacterized protein BXIN_1786 [Babesia sp. Xinjiang]|uniref:uncharacterized protein n=1 Tax=Babesia sp. Xinjiang TaxID=462227 RepID=UPI000A23AF66|nr:uncharacterized protein BXIN_1632 [Babesia sp. Xinjiang]XP_028871444.1 uncharacterized protein BXIN_1786 [Babesia sp. Xinjiang]ORM40841.1 hypothetical protein BXIN_1632 [Babesia sp. Xinjiang]ORM40988.1 hypothetical protein BXIN_1786 [Babesia sp. Xinjiang]
MAPCRLTHYRYFSTSEVVEKGLRALEILKVDPQRLRDNRDVVVYTRNRVCPDCKREVCIRTPEFAETICPAAWRYLHGFSQKCQCPLIGVMRFTRFGKLRVELRARLEATGSNSVTEN